MSALLGVCRSLMASLALHDLSIHLFLGSSSMGSRCYGCGRGVWEGRHGGVSGLGSGVGDRSPCIVAAWLLKDCESWV